MESIQQGHPQAAIMLEYAQVAATNKEPWKEFEYFHERLNQWFECPEMINLNYVTTLRRKSKVMHKIGNIYKFSDGSEYMIVSSGDDSVIMVAIKGSFRGCRINRSVQVQNNWKISEEEFEEIVDGMENNSSDFTLISSND